MMTLEVSCSYQLRLVLVTRDSGCDSIFTKAEAYMRDNYRCGQFLRKMIEDTNMELEYRSLMDLLFCEIFRQFIPHCKKFYDGKGPLLKHYITPETVKLFDEYLTNTFKMATILCGQRVKCSWNDFIEFVKPRDTSVLTMTPILQTNYCFPCVGDDIPQIENI